MSGSWVRTTMSITLVTSLLLALSDGHASDDAWEHETWRWTPLEKKAARRCFVGDHSGGMKFKRKRKKVDGEKRRGMQLKSKQDSGFGFVNTGCRLGLDWKVSATFNYRKDKGLRDGSTFAGLEVDYPYVPMGTMPTDFIFVGATWHKDGISTFVNDSGTTVGAQASYPGSRAVDIRIRYLAGTEYTISTRSTGTLPWDLLFTGDPDLPLEDEAGLGFGLNNVDKGGRVFLCALEMDGEIFTGAKEWFLSDVLEAIGDETEALDATDLREKKDALVNALVVLESLVDDLDEAVRKGEIDLDPEAVKLLEKAIKLDVKVADKLSKPEMVWGTRERKRIEKAIAKKRKAMELIKKMRVIF